MDEDPEFTEAIAQSMALTNVYGPIPTRSIGPPMTDEPEPLIEMGLQAGRCLGCMHWLADMAAVHAGHACICACSRCIEADTTLTCYFCSRPTVAWVKVHVEPGMYQQE